MGYSLAAKFCSEFVGMTFTIFLGEAILANEILPSTKGHGLGFFGVAFGFGLAFGVNIAWFGWISAHLNPAMFFFLAILGDENKLEYGWVEFVVCSIADFLGAFCGAVLVAVFFFPHFATIPLPPDETGASEVATLVQGPVSLEPNAGRIASAFGTASCKPHDVTLGTELRNVGNKTLLLFQRQQQQHRGYDASQREQLLEKMEMRHKARSALLVSQTQQQSLLRRQNSIQVATLLHQHDKPLVDKKKEQVEEEDDDLNAWTRRHSAQVAGLLHTHDNNDNKRKQANDEGKSTVVTASEEPSAEMIPNENTTVKFHEEKREEKDDEEDSKQKQALLEYQKEQQQQIAYKAALDADAHAKLAIFATRPALYNRPMNFLQELLATAMLVLGAELFVLRRDVQEEATGIVTEGPYSHAIMISFFITTLILGLGGPTGLAVNPARDLGPRVAHAVLPLPGKGSSNEWHYGLVVPLWAPFVGAAVGAGIYKGLEALYESGS